jgi:hypothetical protein
MAVPAKLRDPNDPKQILRTKKGDVVFEEKFWIVGPGVGKIIGRTPEGGYRYARGGPIRSRQELELLPSEEQGRALAWWDNRDKWQATAPRKIEFQQGTGYPIFADNGEYVNQEEQLLTNWPGDSPIFWAALKALEKRRNAPAAEKPMINTFESATQPEPAPAPVPVQTPVNEPRKLPSLHATKGKKIPKEEIDRRMAKARATREANKAKFAPKMPEKSPEPAAVPE